MPNCPKCNAEVDADQKICAWCGEEISLSGPTRPAPPPPPRQPAPPPATSRSPSSQTVVSRGKGPSAEDARNLAKLGDLDGASRLYRDILEASPNDQEGLFGLGGIFFKRLEYKKALELWLKLKVVNPAYPNIDHWVSEAQKHLSPSTLSMAAPPAPETSGRPTLGQGAAPPAAPPKPLAPPPMGGESFPESESSGDDDWRQQSVRVGEIDEGELEEPAPEPEPVPQPEPDEIPDVDIRDEGAPPAWIRPVAWALTLVFLAALYGIYFL